MQVFLILGHSTASPELASGVCGKGSTQREAAEDYYVTYCGHLNVDPDSMPQNAHHEQMIDVKVALETSPLGEPVEFPQDDFVLCAVQVDVPQADRFGHVADEQLRTLLNTGVGDITKAVTASSRALSADQQDEDVSGTVWNARRRALDVALRYSSSDQDLTLDALRRFWSV